MKDYPGKIRAQKHLDGYNRRERTRNLVIKRQMIWNVKLISNKPLCATFSL